jgi:hypothetical protein
MELKTVTIEGVTYAAVQDGKPVYIDAGKEVAFDAVGTRATITRLNGEAQSHRERAEKAEGDLKAFDGLSPTVARDALDKLTKIDTKKLVEAGDMDAAIQTALKPVQEDLAKERQRNEELTGSYHKEVIGNAFGRSKFATEKLTPAGVDLVRTMFADRLKVEGEAPVGYDPNGQKIFSRARPGEVANFDEVVEALVETYPYKDHILKGMIGAGGGAPPGGGGGGGPKTIPRGQWDTMGQAERMAKTKDGFKVVD